MKEITLKEFADQYNTVLNRRGKTMSAGYLYRLIRQDAGKEKTVKKTCELWFKYKFKGKKDSIRIII